MYHLLDSETELVCHLKNYLQGRFNEYPAACTWAHDLALPPSPSHLRSVLYLRSCVEWCDALCNTCATLEHPSDAVRLIRRGGEVFNRLKAQTCGVKER